MTPAEARQILRHSDLRTHLIRASELTTDLALGTEPPHRMFRDVDSQILAVIEDVLLRVLVDIPSPSEWAAEQDADQAADRQREESLGL